MNVGTYKITSGLATSPYFRKLNLYSSGSVSNGMNVVLYETDQSDEQKWYFDGERLYPETDSTHSYCLDRYAASAYLNNADIWKASAADADCQKLSIIPVSADDDYYRIRLDTKVNNEYYYLTAYSNANGTGSGKSTTSAGNVYWAPATGGWNQKWDFSEVGGSSSGNTGGSSNDNENIDIALGDMINTNTTGFSNINILTSWKNADTDRYGISHWNCTFYCWGRAYDVTGGTCLPMNKTAYKWYSEYTPDGTFTKRTAAQGPVDRCIAVLKKASGDDTGHVVFIEKVLEDGMVYYSEANMTGYEDGVVRLATIINGEYKMQRGNTVTNQPWYTANVLGYIVPVNQ